ncbi:MAG: YgfZ/GcvT domain-containing protein [Thioalkalivibrionaceae bacterium]
MIERWNTVLEDHGAEWTGERLAHFGNPERERRMASTGDVMADLSHFDLIEVTGDDATDFLQGQFGNDIRQVSAERGQLSFYASPKGRAYAVFYVVPAPAGYFLIVPGGVAEALIQRLRMFVLRAKVQIESANDARVRIGLSGPNSPRELAEAIGITQQHAEPYALISHNGVQALRIPAPQPRFIVLVDNFDRARALWEQFNVRMAPIGRDAWTLGDILAGLPLVTPETREHFVPQMLNLGVLGGISFAKGCYPGQEVVARMHYLGKLKRAMLRYAATCEEPPAPGTPIVSLRAGNQTGADADPDTASAASVASNTSTSDNTTVVGEIVAASLHPDERMALLAVMQLAHADDELALGDANGPRLTRIVMPYALPETA